MRGGLGVGGDGQKDTGLYDTFGFGAGGVGAAPPPPPHHPPLITPCAALFPARPVRSALIIGL